MGLVVELLNVMGRVAAASDVKFSLRQGDLPVGSAESSEEIAAAQSLRYWVFYEEMNVNPSFELELL